LYLKVENTFFSNQSPIDVTDDKASGKTTQIKHNNTYSNLKIGDMNNYWQQTINLCSVQH